MTALQDLTPSQIRMMIRLDDGKAHHDSTGLRLIDMTIEMASEANWLVRMGLVEAWGGRGEPSGYRLTEKGRDVREKGWA